MGGRKTFQNSAVSSSIRYRRLLEENTFNSEQIGMPMGESSMKLQKHKEFVYILCRFCGHKQKVHLVDDALREELRNLRATALPKCVSLTFHLSKNLTSHNRILLSPKLTVLDGKTTMDTNQSTCCFKTRCTYDIGKQAVLGRNELTLSTAFVQSSVSCCGRLLYGSSDEPAVTGNLFSDIEQSISPPLPERVDSLINVEEQRALKEAPWFQAGISREIALEILNRQSVGSFLVRNSTSKPGCYALSLRVPNEYRPKGIANYLILETNRGFKIKGFTKEFPSLTSLIIHHSVMPELLPCPLVLSGNSKCSENSTDFIEIACSTHCLQRSGVD